MSEPAVNTDREIWRERPDDYYSDSIHVTEGGGIGINCGGTVIVMPVRSWHAFSESDFCTTGEVVSSPFTPEPVSPTIHLLAVYFDGGVLRRLWVWPGQIGDQCEPAGDALGHMLDTIHDRTKPWYVA